MLKSFSFDLRVYHEDVDTFGVVYHPNFLKFMERARLEWALAEGHDFHRWEKEGISFTIHSAKLEYTRPAKVYDFLQVASTITEIKRVSLVYEQIIRAPNNPEIVYCKGQIRVVCVDDKFRPRLLPEGFFRK